MCSFLLRSLVFSIGVIFGFSACFEVPPVLLVRPRAMYGIPCTKHTDCDSGICFPGFLFAKPPEKVTPHTCIPSDLVRYVDGSACDSSKSDLSHQGTPQDPFCQISTALGQGAFVSIKPSREVKGYVPTEIPFGKAVMLVGKDRSLATLVQGIQVQGVGTEAYLEGLTLSTYTDITSPSMGVGLSCTGQASVSIRSSVVSTNKTGILASQCKRLQVQNTYVGHNADRGFLITNGSEYQILNSLIVKNGGVALELGSRGMIDFTTVAYNGTDPKASSGKNGGALSCLPEADSSGNNPVLVRNTLLIGNQMNLASPMPTQLQGNTCKLQTVIVSVKDTLASIHPTSKGITKTEVVFLQQGTEWTLDLRAPSWDSSLLIDRAGVDATDLIDQDYFGTPRPRDVKLRKPGGSGYDMGHQQISSSQ